MYNFSKSRILTYEPTVRIFPEEVQWHCGRTTRIDQSARAFNSIYATYVYVSFSTKEIDLLLFYNLCL